MISSESKLLATINYFVAEQSSHKTPVSISTVAKWDLSLRWALSPGINQPTLRQSLIVAMVTQLSSAVRTICMQIRSRAEETLLALLPSHPGVL